MHSQCSPLLPERVEKEVCGCVAGNEEELVVERVAHRNCLKQFQEDCSRQCLGNIFRKEKSGYLRLCFIFQASRAGERGGE